MTEQTKDPADETTIVLSAKDWEKFMAELEAPARTHPRLAALLASKAPWDDDAEPRPLLPSLDTSTS
jgi:Protein of unknown function (DUF1778)